MHLRCGTPQILSPSPLTSILRSKARELLYVSCNPVTLARDAAALAAGGFVTRAIHTFAMFPQTSHLEILLHAERGPRPRGG